ncbi:hypothetical protein ACGFI3_25685 [Nonomuraea wenchangensis]|uniref:hypothetical protein n=1 Tax=Nonomuraea wenchangensis TaxID=568860 RepID=UPI003722BA7C
MPVVAFPGPHGPASPHGGPADERITVAGAVARFLDSLAVATTRRSYAGTLTRLAAVTGPHQQVAALDCDDHATVMHHWTAAEAAPGRHPSPCPSPSLTLPAGC